MYPGIRFRLAGLLFAGMLVASNLSAQSAFAGSVAMSDSADVVYFSSVYPLRDDLVRDDLVRDDLRRVLRWDGTTGKLNAVAREAYEIRTSADGRTFVFADRDGLWAVPPNGRVLPFPSGPGVSQIALHSSGRYLCSTSGPNGAMVWSLTADERWAAGRNTACRAFLTDDRIVIEDWTEDPQHSKLVIWSFLTHTFEPVNVEFPPGSSFLGISRNGEYLLVSSPSSEVRRYHLPSRSVSEFPPNLSFSGISADGLRFLASTPYPDARLVTGEFEKPNDWKPVWREPDMKPAGAAFSPDGQSVVAVLEDARLVRYDIATGAVREILPLTPVVESACAQVIAPGMACRIRNAPPDTKVELDGRELAVYNHPAVGGPYFVVPRDLEKGQHKLRVLSVSSQVAAPALVLKYTDPALRLYSSATESGEELKGPETTLSPAALVRVAVTGVPSDRKPRVFYHPYQFEVLGPVVEAEVEAVDGLKDGGGVQLVSVRIPFLDFPNNQRAGQPPQRRAELDFGYHKPFGSIRVSIYLPPLEE